jgi:uncharacterized membrane protein HdeD (DUF308 family)
MTTAVLAGNLSPGERHEVERMSAKWWVLLVTGILWVIIGLMVLDANVDSAAIIGFLIGAYLIGAGMTEFMMIAMLEDWKWVHGILGVLFVVVGISCFFSPVQTFGVLARLFGLLIVLKGLFDVIAALATKHVADLWWMTLIAGILEIVLGMWASGYVGRSAALLILWVGIGALLRGVTQIILSFQVRKVHGAVA